MLRPSRLVFAVAILAVSACSPDQSIVAVDLEPVSARGPSNSTATASWQIFDVTSTGAATSVVSDGRGPYTNGSCGVDAKIFYWGDGGAGDATFDPDAGYNKKNCASPRRWRITFPNGSSLLTGNFISAIQMSTIPVGTTTAANVSFTVDQPNCTRVLFRDQIVTRTTTATGKPQWVYESGPASSAICRVLVGGTMTDIGEPLTMTLRITISQN